MRSGAKGLDSVLRYNILLAPSAYWFSSEACAKERSATGQCFANARSTDFQLVARTAVTTICAARPFKLSLVSAAAPAAASDSCIRLTPREDPYILRRAGAEVAAAFRPTLYSRACFKVP